MARGVQAHGRETIDGLRRVDVGSRTFLMSLDPWITATRRLSGLLFPGPSRVTPTLGEPGFALSAFQDDGEPPAWIVKLVDSPFTATSSERQARSRFSLRTVLATGRCPTMHEHRRRQSEPTCRLSPVSMQGTGLSGRWTRPLAEPNRHVQLDHHLGASRGDVVPGPSAMRWAPIMPIRPHRRGNGLRRSLRQLKCHL
jgi:hypothetical protein